MTNLIKFTFSQQCSPLLTHVVTCVHVEPTSLCCVRCHNTVRSPSGYDITRNVEPRLQMSLRVIVVTVQLSSCLSTRLGSPCAVRRQPPVRLLQASSFGYLLSFRLRASSRCGDSAGLTRLSTSLSCQLRAELVYSLVATRLTHVVARILRIVEPSAFRQLLSRFVTAYNLNSYPTS